MTAIHTISDILGKEGFRRVRSKRQSGMPTFFCKENVRDFVSYISLRYLTTYRAYDVRMGVEYGCIRPTLERVLPDYAYGRYPVAEMLDISGNPCLTMFSMNRYLGWGISGLPVANVDEISMHVSKMVEDAYKPLFSPIANMQLLLSLLLKEEAPYEWGLTATFSRVAQIACLVNRNRCVYQLARSVVEKNFDSLKRDIFCGWENISSFDALCSALADESNS
jgi:hypothetical protein